MPAKPAIYLDANASAPLVPSVRAELTELLKSDATFPSNPSSAHAHGRESRRRIHEARDAVATSWRVRSDQITFTSSGTEANQTVIRSAIKAFSGRSPIWITSSVEHESVRGLVAALRRESVQVEILPVDFRGLISLTDLSHALANFQGRVALVSGLWVNNETGVISPVDSLIELCRKFGVPIHLDAAQAWGKLPLNLGTSGASHVTFSGHKIGALPGTGAIYSDFPLTHALVTGKQERGSRGGTENLLGIVSMGIAARSLVPEIYDRQLRGLRDEFESLIRARCMPVIVQGGEAARVANTSCLTFPGTRPDSLVPALDVLGFSVSTGSACMSGAAEPSAVLLAMGVSEADARASVRVSLHSEVTREDVLNLVEALVQVTVRLRPSTTRDPRSPLRSSAELA